METKVVYKPITKKFMNIADVRVVPVGIKEYVVLKDVFNALGLLDSRGDIPSAYKSTLASFLNGIGCDRKSFMVTSKSKKSRSRETQQVDCLDIEVVPLVITQYKPSARRGEDALNQWFDFMKFVNNLLLEHEAYKVIFKDKEEQKHIGYTITQDMDKSMVIVNTHVAIIMAKLIGVYDQGIKKITKDELKIYQPRVTIDLIEVRQEALKLYQEFLLAFDDYKMAIDGVLNCLKRKYRL